MASTKTTSKATRCLRCNRPLRSARAVARRYGDGCWAKVSRARQVADLSAWTPSQIEDAQLAIEDGAVVPSTRDGVFHVVSVDGSEVHRTALHGCNCTNGLRTLPPRPCWHRCAVAMVVAASAPAALPAGTSPRNIPLPAAPAASPDVPATRSAPASDVWAALEAAGALSLIPAF